MTSDPNLLWSFGPAIGFLIVLARRWTRRTVDTQVRWRDGDICDGATYVALKG